MIDQIEKPARYDAAADFAAQCTFGGIPHPEREVRFAAEVGRQWRFDYYWRRFKLAVEIEGIIVFRDKDGRLQTGGGHASITGMKRDMIKSNTAILMKIDVLRFEQSMVKSRYAYNTTYRALCGRGWKPKS